MAKLVILSDTTFATDVAKGVMLVDFWATWCGPCKQIAPVVEQIASENDGKMSVGKLDVDVNGATAMKYGVMSIPTLILFKDGQPVETLVGFMPEKQILAKVEKHINQSASTEASTG